MLKAAQALEKLMIDVDGFYSAPDSDIAKEMIDAYNEGDEEKYLSMLKKSAVSAIYPINV